MQDISVYARNNEEEGYNSVSFTHFFIAEQALGTFLLAVLLLTVLISPSIRRNITWITFIISWIISGLSYILLAFFGRATGPQPWFSLCVAQATLIYAAPPLCAFAALALSIQLWLDVSLVDTHKRYPWVITALHVVPWIVFVGIIIEALAIGLNERNIVLRKAYCVIPGIPGQISSAFVALPLILGIVFQILIARTIIRQRRAVSASYKTGAFLSMLIRMGLASFVIIFVFCFSLVFLPSRTYSELPNGILGMLPLITFLLFGIQTDILRIWMFWRKQNLQSLPDEIAAKKSTDIV